VLGGLVDYSYPNERTTPFIRVKVTLGMPLWRRLKETSRNLGSGMGATRAQVT